MQKIERTDVRFQRSESRKVAEIVDDLLRVCGEAGVPFDDPKARKTLKRAQARISLLLYGREIGFCVS